MPSERERRALEDIKENILLAVEFAAEMTATELAQDRKAFYAVVRCLEIISEASRRLSPETADRHSGLPWAEIRAAGNVYRHEYGEVAPRRVHLTLKQSLPHLLAVVEAELTATSAAKPGSGNV